MKSISIKSKAVLLLFLGLLSFKTSHAVINAFCFIVDVVDAQGNNVQNCFNVCKGETFYIRNRSTMGGSGCQAGISPINAPLNGTLTAKFGLNTVVNMTVTNWAYNGIVPVTINSIITTTSTVQHACGTGLGNVYFYYYGSDVNTTVCSTINYHQHMLYGRVNNLPVANAGADVSICAGQSTTLTASGGTSYVWNGGSLNNASGASQIVSPTSNTTYTVTVTNSSGCTQNDAVTVTVNPLPANTLQNYVLCPGDAWPVLDAGAGNTSYVWYFNGSPLGIGQTMPTFAYGTYSVTVTNVYGCTATYSSVVSLSPSATADPSFTISLQTQQNGTVVITGSANSLNWYNTWQLHNSNSNCDQQVTPAQSQSYTGLFNGQSHTFTAVPDNNWYVIKHIAAKKPCNVPFESTTCIFISDNRRIMFEQTDGAVITNNMFSTRLYPNPGDGKVNLEISGNDENVETIVEVLDMQGRTVSSSVYVAGSGPMSIDLTNEPKGIYMVRVINGDRVSRSKVVVE